jgi:multimeric flavodoxin WrbA
MVHVAKKVLILSASPRKGGNSDLLCDQFLRGAKEAGNQAEKIFLRDKKINYCTGCGACQEEGGKCVQKDDMAEILDKMVAVDVIVMATPVYFYTMNAQMKTLIDRTCARYTEIRNKDFYFIVAAADTSKRAMGRTLEGFRAFTSCLSRPKEKGVIYGTGAWKAGDIKGSKAMTQAYEMGSQV